MSKNNSSYFCKSNGNKSQFLYGLKLADFLAGTSAVLSLPFWCMRTLGLCSSGKQEDVSLPDLGEASSPGGYLEQPVSIFFRVSPLSKCTQYGKGCQPVWGPNHPAIMGSHTVIYQWQGPFCPYSSGFSLSLWMEDSTPPSTAIKMQLLGWETHISLSKKNMATLSGNGGQGTLITLWLSSAVAPGTQQEKKAVIAVFLLTQCPTCVAGTPQGQVPLYVGSIQRIH